MRKLFLILLIIISFGVTSCGNYNEIEKERNSRGYYEAGIDWGYFLIATLFVIVGGIAIFSGASIPVGIILLALGLIFFGSEWGKDGDYFVNWTEKENVQELIDRPVYDKIFWN